MKLKIILLIAIAATLWQTAKAGEIIFGWNKVNDAGGIQDMHFMPDESKFILTTTGKEVQIRSSATGDLIQKFPGIEGLFDFTPDSNRLIFVVGPVQGAKIELRNLSDLSLIKSDSFQLGADTLDPIYHTKLNLWLLDMAVDPVRPYIYLILEKTNNILNPNVDTVRIIVYNYETMQLVTNLTTFGDSKYECIAVSKDGKYLAALNDGKGFLKVWDLASMKLIRNFQLYDSNLQKKYWCEPRVIKFSNINTDKIFFSGTFPNSKIIPNNGLFIYDVQLNKIIDSTFNYIVGGLFAIFDNEERAMKVDGTYIDIINFNVQKKETTIGISFQIPFYHNIIYSNNFKYFIGNDAEYFAMVKFDSINSITDLQQEIKVIYPNPTNGTAKIELISSIKELTYEIFDINGVLISPSIKIQPEQSSLTIDFSKYPDDIYLIRLYNGIEVIIYKIIKKN